MNNSKTKISHKLNLIQEVFDVEKILKTDCTEETIKKYYAVNKLPYTIFYSREGLLHMGISKGDEFKSEDLWEQARLINEYIKESDAKNVLELATGRGPNTIRLAEDNPDVAFVGLDMSKHQLSVAQKKSKKFDNVSFVEGDFHDLHNIESNSIDICFNIEALCYSKNKEQVFKEILRVLKPSGLFIVFDGYSTDNRISDKTSDTAMTLVEIGMAVPYFDLYSEFIKKALTSGFELHYEKDYSTNILPSMRRMERLATLFLRFPRVAKVLSKLLPSSFVYNSITGYLMPDVIEAEIASYMMSIFRKP